MALGKSLPSMSCSILICKVEVAWTTFGVKEKKVKTLASVGGGRRRVWLELSGRGLVEVNSGSGGPDKGLG